MKMMMMTLMVLTLTTSAFAADCTREMNELTANLKTLADYDNFTVGAINSIGDEITRAARATTNGQMFNAFGSRLTNYAHFFSEKRLDLRGQIQSSLTQYSDCVKLP
jgi:hypothetical protein